MYKKNVLNSHGKNMTPELCGIILVIRVNYYFCAII
jgi:hypothetical protein